MMNCLFHTLAASPSPSFGPTEFSDNRDLIALGGQADLFCGKASHPGLNRIIVVKCFRVFTDPRLIAEYDVMKNEETTYRLLGSHMNISSFLGTAGATMAGPTLYHPTSLVFEHYPNGDLIWHLCLTDPGRQNAEQRLKLLAQVASGIRHIHSKSIVHGDLKAVNVLVDGKDYNNARICDFGSSLSICPCYEWEAYRSGTLPWDSPEIYEGDDPVRTQWSDIWAFGCLALQVQMGVEPWHNTNKNNIMIRLMKKGQPAKKADLDLDGNQMLLRVWELIETCWDQIPERRPTSDELASQLSSLI